MEQIHVITLEKVICLAKQEYKEMSREALEKVSNDVVRNAMEHSPTFSLPQCFRLGYYFAMEQIKDMSEAQYTASNFYKAIQEVLEEMDGLQSQEFDLPQRAVADIDEERYLRSHTREAKVMYPSCKVVETQRASRALERAYYRGYCVGAKAKTFI